MAKKRIQFDDHSVTIFESYRDLYFYVKKFLANEILLYLLNNKKNYDEHRYEELKDKALTVLTNHALKNITGSNSKDIRYILEDTSKIIAKEKQLDSEKFLVDIIEYFCKMK